MRVKRQLAVLGALIGTVMLVGVAQAGGPSSWAPAQKIDEIDGNSSELNTPFLDGCPIQSPDGRSLYLASNRPGGLGGIDIWVARRSGRHAPWGAPVNLGAPVNSEANDFCPTPIRGRGLFFVSNRTGFCGTDPNADIYFTRYSRRHGWGEPHHLACTDAGGPNSGLDEQGPSYVTAGRKASLYFSRSSMSVPGDIFVSEGRAGRGFGPAEPVAELNDATANDIQPNVRKDGREVVFSSNRTGTLGLQDIWVSTRRSIRDPWSTPVNLGSNVNTAEAAETRPSLSWDARTLLFGRAPGPEGMSDIFVTTREEDEEDDH